MAPLTFEVSLLERLPSDGFVVLTPFEHCQRERCPHDVLAQGPAHILVVDWCFTVDRNAGVAPRQQRLGEGRIQQAFIEEHGNHPAAPDFRERLVGAEGNEEEPVAAIETGYQHDGMPAGVPHGVGAEGLVAADLGCLDWPARRLAEIGGENTEDD